MAIRYKALTELYQETQRKVTAPAEWQQFLTSACRNYTQFKQFWKYIVTRTAKPRIARKPVNGKYEKYMLYPELGEKARNNSHVVYSLDFKVTPHMLRHTYITNLIHSSVDPKTVQYLAGHKSSKITMDIYAKVKYNKPDQLAGLLNSAFVQWDADSCGAAQ